jgi:hypothetical protein
VSRPAGLEPGWKVGFEVELLAPRGRSRRDVAEAIALDHGATVEVAFQLQSEPSKVRGKPIFHSLTLAFDVIGADGARIARCADDLTLVADLDRSAAPKEGWYRVLSDDVRFLRLVNRHGRADGTVRDALEPVAALFGTTVDLAEGGVLRVSDDGGSSVCLGARLPGERERPCEIVTAPLESNAGATLGRLLGVAKEQGCTVPVEAAVHVHLDGAALRDPRAFRDLVRLWRRHGDEIKGLVGTNPRCVRLGGWPDALDGIVEDPKFVRLSWPEAQARLREAGLVKFCDLNVANLVYDVPGKPTVEFRVLPGGLEPEPMLAGARVAEQLVRAAVDGSHRDGNAIRVLRIPDDVRRHLPS